MYNRYNRTKGIGTLQNPKAEIDTKGMLGTVVDNLTGGLGSTLLGGLFGNKSSKDSAAAAAQDQRTTGTSNEFFQQLQQAISQMDKSVAEKLFGTSNTTDVIKQLEALSAQSSTDQSQTTIRGDAGANNAVLQNIMQLSGQLANGGDDAMTAAINKTLRSGAGALAGVGNRSGTFGDTTTAILQNDLATRSAEAGVLAKQNAQTATSNSLAQLMQSLQAGQEVTTGKQNTATTQDKTNTGTNTSNTSTTQDRTANETATDRTSTSTSGQSNKTEDSYTDFYKDGSSGFGTTKGNPIAQLGVGVGTGGITTAPPGGQLTQTPLALPSLPASGPNLQAVMGQAPGANPLAALAPTAPGGVQQPEVVQPGAMAAAGGPVAGQAAEVNPLLAMMDNPDQLDPTNPLGKMQIGLPAYTPINRFSLS